MEKERGERTEQNRRDQRERCSAAKRKEPAFNAGPNERKRRAINGERLSPRRDRIQKRETRNKKQETRSEKQETRNKKRETRGRTYNVRRKKERKKRGCEPRKRDTQIYDY